MLKSLIFSFKSTYLSYEDRFKKQKNFISKNGSYENKRKKIDRTQLTY